MKKLIEFFQKKTLSPIKKILNKGFFIDLKKMETLDFMTLSQEFLNLLEENSIEITTARMIALCRHSEKVLGKNKIKEMRGAGTWPEKVNRRAKVILSNPLYPWSRDFKNNVFTVIWRIEGDYIVLVEYAGRKELCYAEPNMLIFIE